MKIDNTFFSLYEFNTLIKESLGLTFPGSYLITAEIASIRQDGKGHCYLDLVEKSDRAIIAQADGRIWASTYRVVGPQFRKTTGIPLSKGLKILIRATLNFHERYGLSLIIQSIDPSYTLGEMARKRREVIDRLRKEGLIDRNKGLSLPLVPQRIGVISSGKAAGLEDFMNHLKKNPFAYTFSVRLYEAIMQGDMAEASLLRALYQCNRERASLDLVLIVRGGGRPQTLTALTATRSVR